MNSKRGEEKSTQEAKNGTTIGEKGQKKVERLGVVEIVGQRVRRRLADMASLHVQEELLDPLLDTTTLPTMFNVQCTICTSRKR